MPKAEREKEQERGESIAERRERWRRVCQEAVDKELERERHEEFPSEGGEGAGYARWVLALLREVESLEAQRDRLARTLNEIGALLRVANDGACPASTNETEGEGD
jgi:hypothetical protein